MKNPTPETKQQTGAQQKNWNAGKSEKDLNEKNFSSRDSGLDDDTQRDMDLSDDEDIDTDDMDLSSDDDTEVNSESPRGAQASQGMPRTQKSEGSKSLGRDSNRESTLGATRHDGPSTSRKQ